MNPLLLNRLAPCDIAWLLSHGQKQTFESQVCLSRPDSSQDFFYLIIEGKFSLSLLPRQVNSQPNTQVHPVEFIQFQSGEIISPIPFLKQFLPNGLIQSLVPSVVLAVPQNVLEKKLLDDIPFAARFYRSLAQFLANRLAYLSHRCGYSLGLLKQMQLKEASTVFAALRDGDLDWLIAVGKVQEYQGGDRITTSHEPLESLDIILEGGISLSATEESFSGMQATFSDPNQLLRALEFSRLSRGDLLGEMLFVESLPPVYAARALRETRILSIPRWRLETKLIYDLEFSARLYRTLAIVLANKQQSVLSEIGFQVSVQELDEQLLSKVALAEARFEWMLKRLRSHTEPSNTAYPQIAA